MAHRNGRLMGLSVRQLASVAAAMTPLMFATAPGAARAQQDTARTAIDSTAAAKVAARLDPVIVTVTRAGGRSVLNSPFALSVTRPDSARPGQRHVSIDETLALVPGLAASSRNNPSQDARISIRGFGARSAFGVRGVRVLRDGMPLTLPDGQTPLDYLSPESVGQIEVIRGSASALYGNASGGVIDIRSAAPASTTLSADVRQWLGSNAFRRTVIAASGRSGSVHYIGDAARSSTDGARAHSHQRTTIGFARAGARTGGTDYAVSLLALDMPLAENPGALTRDELQQDPGQADALSLRRNARKAVRQIQLGVSASRAIGRGELSLAAFGGARSLNNPLTFAIVEIGRHSYGASARLTNVLSLAGLANRWTGGVDIQTQNDLRRNFATCADTVPLTAPTASCPSIDSERGIVTLDQRELVSSVGLYFSDDITISDRVSATFGVRGDNIRFDVRDRLVTAGNPDDSGERLLRAVSPMMGGVLRLSADKSAYFNVASAFETPTATELGNHADGSAGINSDLDPQRSTTFEAGVKGFFGWHIRYDAAVYSTRVSDELVPFEIPGSSGRRYFRNAGRTARRGAEAGAEIALDPLRLGIAYSYSRFRFDKYEAGSVRFDGNEIPGIPRHRLQGAVTWSRRGSFASIETERVSEVFVDDANSGRAPGYELANVRFGAQLLRRPRLSMTFAVQNVFDRRYAPSIAVNAAREKFFEPAPGRTSFIGLSLGARR